MISILYGLPGCGKTTTEAYVIYCNNVLKKRYERKMNSRKANRLRRRLEKRPNSKYLQRKYERFSRVPFYTTFYSTDETMKGTVHVPYKDLGKFRPKPNSCFLLEEAGIGLSSRDFSKLSSYSKRFAAMHRHQHCDIILVSQSVDIDKAYRDRCDCVFHLKKMGPFTWIHRLSHKLMIDESTHDIVEGYFLPSALSSIWETLSSAIFHRIEKQPMIRSRIIYRPKYYPFFDSYEDIFDYPQEDPALVHPDYKFVPTEKKGIKEQLQEIGFKLLKGKKDVLVIPESVPDKLDTEDPGFDEIIEAMFA